ncbi:MAG: ABC transporter permease [Chromatiales bacterium]|jgi:putative ABC transport system permease protein|nr:ABC transporter permease [Chromatiales bacterium]MDH3895256.1 ABC transporter permease [Chromatiales bacterium]MDH3932858.1 ABC transporter permease [Chromatiales bacterium]MDH3945125.1 ABC transporter permease [Chromatiales bacterium]MDH4012425.1 ABC transporter permease [Chromatiales bacterium]
MNYVVLDLGDVLIAATLLLINGAISVALALGLGRSLLVAAVRMVVQLALVGLVLRWLFESVSPWLTLIAALVMVGFAGYEAMARQEQRLAGGWGFGIGALAMGFAGISVTVLALGAVFQPDPWFQPRFAVPILGMVLGNCMTGVAIALNQFLTQARQGRRGVEAMLALGYERDEALAPLRRPAARAGMIPIINSMAAAGVVFLPGMMTGQILAGVEPGQAVKYQMVIMFLIAGGTAIGVLLALFGASRRLSDDRHRLRLDRLQS